MSRSSNHPTKGSVARKQKWKPAKPSCLVCKKSDGRCRITEDESTALCRHKAEGGKEHTCKNGEYVWIHRLKDTPTNGVLNHQDSPARSREEQPPLPLAADPDTLHQVYSDFLELLELSDDHREDLRRRRLSDDAIARNCYRSMVPDRLGLVEKLTRRHNRERLLSVPGFYLDEKAGCLSVTAKPGLLVPVRDTTGRIIRLKYKPDKQPESGGKYRWVSSASKGGPSSGAPPHVPAGAGAPSAVGRLTEGEIKCDVAFAHDRMPVIGAPGVSVFLPCLEVAKTLGWKTIRLAYDADWRTNKNVARALFACANAIVERGFVLEIELWDVADGKGIDDLLAGGKTPYVAAGDEVNGVLSQAAFIAGIEVELDIPAIAARIATLKTPAELATIYRDKNFLADLARLKNQDPDEFLAMTAELKRIKGFSIRELNKSLGRNRSQPERTSDSPDQNWVAAGTEENPHRLARKLLDNKFRVEGKLKIGFWRDDFHVWYRSAYHRAPDSELRGAVSNFLEDEFNDIYTQQLMKMGMARAKGGSGDASQSQGEARLIPVSRSLVDNVIQAMQGLTMITTARYPDQPAWIGGEEHWNPNEVIPAQNMIVHLPSLVEGKPYSCPPTPLFFSSFALDYPFDLEAPEPVVWLNFLNQIWPEDPEAIACLQEYMGYLLTQDTSQQKMLMMIGPRRSGKGTILRVITSLVGEQNTVSPRFSELASGFGLAPLIGKSCSIITDARISRRTDQAPLVECLNAITGEDGLTIGRKFKESWTGKLRVRFILVSNELPMLRDASGALPGRMIVLHFTETFFGREDPTLFDRLLPERAGILHWAIAGWARLRKRGKFLQPASGLELLHEFEAVASPISAFLEECCIVGKGQSALSGAMFQRWKKWAKEMGREHVGDKQSFGRDLRAAVAGLKMSQPREGKSRVRQYEGVGLRPPASSPLTSWLKERLKNGQVRAAVIIQEAITAGHIASDSTEAKAPLWQAKAALGVISEVGPDNRKFWSLPEPEQSNDNDSSQDPH